MAQYYIKDVIKSMLNMQEDKSDNLLTDEVAGVSEKSNESNLQRTSHITSDEDDENPTTADSMGLRSPVLGTRGRSVKEIEEQLATLRKENFNLKLRIYFLEERMGTNFTMDQEDAIKKNIELMVELESLKKEVQEKQELLCQAVKAMDLDEEEHRKISAEKDKQIQELQNQMESLQQKCDLLQEDTTSHSHLDHLSDGGFLNMHCDSQNIIANLEERIADLEEQLRNEKQNTQACSLLSPRSTMVNVDELQLALNEKEEKLAEVTSELEDKCRLILEAHVRLEAFENEVEKSERMASNYKRTMEAKETECKDLRINLDDMRRQLEEMQSVYEYECRKNEKNKLAISNRNAKIVELESAIEKYKGRITNLESKLETSVNEVNSSKNKAASDRRSPGKQRKANVSDSSATLSVRGASSLTDHPPSAKALTTSASVPNNTNLTRSPANSKLHKQVPAQPRNSQNCSAGDEDGAKLMVGEEQDQLQMYRNHLEKLEKERLKACKIIQTLLGGKKKNESEIEELQKNLQKKDVQLADLRERIKKIESGGQERKNSGSGGTLQTRISELNLTAAAPASDTEQFVVNTKTDEQGNLLFMDNEKESAIKRQEEWLKEKEALLETIDKKINQLKAMEETVEALNGEIKAKDLRINDLIETWGGNLDPYDIASNSSNSKEKIDVGTEKVSFWIRENEEKDREIERLESELEKRTHALQGVLNNELWKKNREIEKLLCSVEQNEEKDAELAELRKEITNKENQLKIVFKKLTDMEHNNCSEDVEKMRQKLDACSEQKKDLLKEIDELNNQLSTLRSETSALKGALKDSKELQCGANELCQLLANRLKELALFLDYLLRQKNVLGYIGSEQLSKLLKEKVDESLDLSKTLSHNISIDHDLSLPQLSNITHLLNDSVSKNLSMELANCDNSECDHTENASLSYRSHLYGKDKLDQSRVIEVLRDEIGNLKKEIEVRDHELNKRLGLDEQNAFIEGIVPLSGSSNDSAGQLRSKLHKQQSPQSNKCVDSESESWSEPDRSVSKARIGLDYQNLKPKSPKASESTEARTPPTRTPSKKTAIINQLSDQVHSLEAALRAKEDLLMRSSNTNEQLQLRLTELLEKYGILDLKYQNVDQRCQELSKECTSLRNQCKLLESKCEEEVERLESSLAENQAMRVQIDEVRAELKEAKERKCALENEVILYKGKVENLECYKEMLMDSTDTKIKYTQNRLNELEAEKMQLQQALKQSEQKVNDATKEISHLTDTLINLEITHAKNTAKIVEEAEREIKDRVKNLDEEYKSKIANIEQTSKNKINVMTEAAEKQAKLYETQFVERAELERLQAMIRELDEVKLVLKLSEDRVKTLTESETHLKEKCAQMEREFCVKLQELRNEVDRATLEHSQAVLEKTQIEEQRAELEAQLQQFTSRETIFVDQVAELKTDFKTMRENFKIQLSAKENERARLEAMNSTLEARIAELQSKIVINNHNGNGGVSRSAPTSPNGRILDLYLSNNPNPIYSKHNLHDAFSKEMLNILKQSVGNQQQQQEMKEDELGVDLERFQSNSSPDLGIESDQGRYSSLEAAQPLHAPLVRPFMAPLEVSKNLNDELDRNPLHRENTCGNEKCLHSTHNLRKENQELQKKLQMSNSVLKDTLSKLNKANQRKREIEKNICKELHKTSQVLTIAKANLDSGSETELRK